MKPYAHRSRSSRHPVTHYAVIALVLLVALLLTACLSAEPQAEDAGAADAVEAAQEQLPVPSGLVEIEPLDPAQAAAPARLQIPDVGLDVPVTPMGWRVVTVDGERTTLWDVPPDSVGWHVNSEGAGAAGNVILSGSQLDGEAVFAPLALGTVSAGQEVRLTDADGLVFVYRISEVSDPIPVSGASEEERDIMGSYLASGDQAQLTMITGWPDFTTTHRVFASADFLGILR